ncbi:unnamed protein product [Closterium sp. Naga37s-1]|nr:unnamed protein product [Closterium sp. Naga37s-1]
MHSISINALSDDLLVKILLHSQQPAPRKSASSTLWASVEPRPTYTSQHPYGDESLQQQTDSPLAPPSASADAAFTLLIASVCRRWRRLAQRHVSTLLVKENCVVSRQDLKNAIRCFPNLTRLHLSDGSIETIDDALLAHIASSCPNLKALHVGNEIVPMDWEREEDHPVTEDGLDHLLRCCTQLQHLSLYCAHGAAKLPDAFYHLTRLHTLGLTDCSALESAELSRLASLAALSVDTNPQDDPTPWGLAHLPALTTLSCCNETRLFIPEREQGDDAFSFAQLRFLKSLEFDDVSPRFDLMFPRDSSCSRLERLLLRDCNGLERLPDEIGGLLPCLRQLSIRKCESLSELPHGFASLSCLETLSISLCNIVSLPENFGELPALKSLSLFLKHLTDLSASFSQLTFLGTLNLGRCEELRELPPGFGNLTALRSLCIENAPLLELPEDIGRLANLRVFHLSENRAQKRFPPSFTRLASLTSLGVFLGLGSGTASCAILPSLEDLDVHLAGEAEELPLSLAFCPSLRSFTIQSAGCMQELPNDIGATVQQLRQLHIKHAEELTELPASIAELRSLTCIQVHAPKLSSLPDHVGALSRLRKLDLSNCSALTHLPASLTRLSCLHSLNLSSTSVCSLPPGLAQLTRLKKLDLDGCRQLEGLPKDLTELNCFTGWMSRGVTKCWMVGAESEV